MMAAMKIRAALLGLVLLACVGALPATVAAHGDPMVYEMKRDDMTVRIHVYHDEVIKATVRARERCGKNGASGFLKAEIAEPIPIRDGSFNYDETFDDARGHGRLVLQGGVNPQTIRGVFMFRNLDDTSCGTGRPGNRRVLYTARLQT
jgi:hypothetical protein